MDPAMGLTEPALSDRERLTAAATRLATDWGYAGIDAEAIARAAGLSDGDFHRHFDDEDQCLLAAYDRFVERLHEHISTACADAGQWPERVKAAIASGFEFVQELEPVARMFAVESIKIGPAAIDRRVASIDRAAVRLRSGRNLYPGSAEMPAATEGALVAGVVMLVLEHLLGEEADELHAVETEAVEMVLLPYLGRRRARVVALS